MHSFKSKTRHAPHRGDSMHFRSRFAAACLAALCSATAFGQSGLVDVVEYYNSALDHYFVTWVPDEIAKLDAGTAIKGWKRSGQTFKTFTAAQPGTSPVCRYYIPPGLGDSHFFGRGTTECDATGANNPSFVLEDSAFMHMFMPTLGTCGVGTAAVYRAFSQRPDANHRYMTNRNLRTAMVNKGWQAEGDGPDLVVMCSPTQPNKNVTFYSEPANPLLMSFVPDGGTLTTLFGDKDDTGAPVAFKGMFIQADATTQHVVTLDSTGRLSSVGMADGSRMKFAWQPGGQFNVSFVTADGKNQASVALTQAFAQPPSPVPSESNAQNKAAPIKATLQVSVREAGVLAGNATVTATIEGRATRKTYKVPLLPLGPGQGVYGAGFVNTPSAIPDGAIEGNCNKIVQKTSEACNYFEPVSSFMTSRGCLLLSAEATLVGTLVGFPLLGGVALVGCETAMVATGAVCKVAEVDSGTNSSVCKIIDSTVALYDGDGVRITAKATKGATSGSAQSEFNGATTVADMSVVLTCPPPQVAFNGVCAASLPLSKTWIGDYKYSLAVGSCKVSYPGSAFMLLTQDGATFAGNMILEIFPINTTTCQVNPASVPVFPTITGTIDGDNNLVVTAQGDAGSIYTGTGSFRNGTLNVNISNTSDFGGLGTFLITVK
jgi:hypothetical protein